MGRRETRSLVDSLSSDTRSRAHAEAIERLLLGLGVGCQPSLGKKGFRFGKYTRIPMETVVLRADDHLVRILRVS